jgi:hypothetical protein
VWGSSLVLPPDVAFCGDSNAEIRWLTLISLFELVLVPSLLNGSNAFIKPWVREYTKLLGKNATVDGTQDEDLMREARSLVSRTIVSGIGSKHKVEVTPILNSEATRARLYRQGDASAVLTVLNNVPVIDEDALTWEQVLEFRRDSLAKASFRRMLHWLDSQMVGKSLSFVEDEVAIRLEQYDRSMRKHGLRTVVGTLTALLDSKFLIGATTAVGLSAAALSTPGLSAAGLSAFHAGGIGALIAGAALTVSKVSLHLAKLQIDAEEARNTAAGEIAFVVAARNLSKPPAGS